MSLGKRVGFAAVTVLLLVLAAEGLGRLIWWRLEARALDRRAERGEAQLRNDAINFMKQADRLYGYVLRPGFDRGGHVINAEGFAQRDTVHVGRRPGSLRVIAMGESTTQGHNTDVGNYPVYLKATLQQWARGYVDIEMINAGVSGWTSDQLALRAERQLAAYRPDIVVLYAGWNDFQSYDPYGPPPARSWFEEAYGAVPPGERLGLRSVQLLSAAYVSASTRVAARIKSRGARAAEPPRATADVYRFYRASLDRIVSAYRHQDPGVRIAICTLVGRWPMAPPEDTSDPEWIKGRRLSQTEAAGAVARFNDVIREYARWHDLTLIDAAAAFAHLDRKALMWDFAHMQAEGYELLALVIYEGLVRAGAVTGAPSPRAEVLMAKYRPRRGADVFVRG
jgi:lysophospholipase L1-like esterase